MRVPVKLSNAFKTEFEPKLVDFLLEAQMIPERDSLNSKRFLTRSVAPHVKSLSQLFNRISEKDETNGSDGRKGESRKGGKRFESTIPQTTAIDQESYFTDASNPVNRRLAYFLSFMPPNLFRVASVWSELYRLGFKWPFPDKDLRAVEFGAGTASGACGIVAGERFAPIGLPEKGNFALIEQSKAALNLGAQWFEHYAEGQYEARPFHRRIDLAKAWLPPAAPKFHLFVMSYFLNECDLTPETLAKQFVATCDKHLEDDGMVIIVEPALKLQSRKLLAFRKALLEQPEVISGKVPLKVLLPCLGHQACGALAAEDDWCHEEVSWWRPVYLRTLDSIVGLDRKSLPFSYLVIQKTLKTREEVLPAISTSPIELRYRLVSPSYELGQTREFFVCGQDGKRRARYRIPQKYPIPRRGDILLNATHHGDPALTQIEKAQMVVHDQDLIDED